MDKNVSWQAEGSAQMSGLAAGPGLWPRRAGRRLAAVPAAGRARRSDGHAHEAVQVLLLFGLNPDGSIARG